MAKGVGTRYERFFRGNRPSITWTLHRVNGQSYPKCKLNDSNNHQPNDAGNVSESHSVYPGVVSDIRNRIGVAEQQKWYKPDRYRHSCKECTDYPGEGVVSRGSLTPMAWNVREHLQSAYFDAYI